MNLLKPLLNNYQNICASACQPVFTCAIISVWSPLAFVLPFPTVFSTAINDLHFETLVQRVTRSDLYKFLNFMKFHPLLILKGPGQKHRLCQFPLQMLPDHRLTPSLWVLLKFPSPAIPCVCRIEYDSSLVDEIYSPISVLYININHRGKKIFISL